MATAVAGATPPPLVDVAAAPGALDRLFGRLGAVIVAVVPEGGWEGNRDDSLCGKMRQSDAASLGQETARTAALTVGSGGSATALRTGATPTTVAAETDAAGCLPSSGGVPISCHPGHALPSLASGWRRLFESLDDCCAGTLVTTDAETGSSFTNEPKRIPLSDTAPSSTAAAVAVTPLPTPVSPRPHRVSPRPSPQPCGRRYQSISPTSDPPLAIHPSVRRSALQKGALASLRRAVWRRRRQTRRQVDDPSDDDRQSLGQYLDVHVRPGAAHEDGNLSDLSHSSHGDGSARAQSPLASVKADNIDDAAESSDASTATPLLVHIRYTVYRDESLDREPTSADGTRRKPTSAATSGDAGTARTPTRSRSRSVRLSAASTNSWTEAQKRQHRAVVVQRHAVAADFPTPTAAASAASARRKEYAYI